MKLQIKNVIYKIVFIYVILTLFSCTVNSKKEDVITETSASAGARSAVTDGFTMNTSAKAMNAVSSEEAAEYDVNGIASFDSDKKITKTVDIIAETKTFDDTIEWYKKHVDTYEGSIDNSYVDLGNMESKDYSKSAYFSTRIPANRLDSFLNNFGQQINITYRYDNVRDVTEEYDDTESRIATLKIEEEKLNELMSKAKNVEDMIKIEEKLSDVRSELQNISKRLKHLDRQITYSTVNVTIYEVKELTEVVKDDDYSADNILKQMKKNLEETEKFFWGLLFLIVTHIPAIIATLIVLWIIIVIYTIFYSIFGKKNKKKTQDHDSNDIELNDNDDDKDIELKFYEKTDK